jgi:hypothetical protein
MRLALKIESLGTWRINSTQATVANLKYSITAKVDTHVNEREYLPKNMS